MSASADASLSTHEGESSGEGRRDPSYYRHQHVATDGVIAVTIIHQSSFLPDTLEYNFIVRRTGAPASGAFAPTGGFATLIVAGRTRADSFSIVPLAVSHAVRDRRRWQVSAQTYNVALVPDSFYELCSVPCAKPDTVALKPGARVAVRF